MKQQFINLVFTFQASWFVAVLLAVGRRLHYHVGILYKNPQTYTKIVFHLLRNADKYAKKAPLQSNKILEMTTDDLVPQSLLRWAYREDITPLKFFTCQVPKLSRPLWMQANLESLFQARRWHGGYPRKKLDLKMGFA